LRCFDKLIVVKKIVLLTFFISGIFVLCATAQEKISPNIRNQPLWGPTGYDHAEYYYLPEYDLYYEVKHHRFIFDDGARWTFSKKLVPRFQGIDLYHAYKVVLNESKPFLHHNEHVRDYGEYKTLHSQAFIRDSHEEKYWEIKDHPEHRKWHSGEGTLSSKQ